MEKVSDRSNLNQISLTGIRALIILKKLINGPSSLDEIKQSFVLSGVMDEKQSDDIIRIDLNTLKRVGCQISRSCASTKYKYVLKKHPFSLNITQEEINVLNKAYKKIKNKVDLEKIIQYDDLFKKLSGYVSQEEFKQKLLDISIIKPGKKNLIRALMLDCKQKNIITVEYISPTRKVSFTKQILAKEVIIRNDKIYLLGIDVNSKESCMLNLDRIINILSRVNGEDKDLKDNQVCVIFKLTKFGVAGIDKCEKIIEHNENGYIVEGKYHNEFIAIQRILSFGPDCTVLEPNIIREAVITKLKNMKEMYCD